MSAIVVENLGKSYRISHQQRHDTIRDAFAQGVGNLFARFRHRARVDVEDFWALKDVSFAINSGEVVGIIGRNGAGKSTLLKLLSRITEPTTGRIKIRGRVASLLEVGTGFHPELSGRENIFLNGAILGMSKIEIRRNFDAIVAFAEVERFLDTPVKRYSSGMYVRLAFAVAAHLEPEVLIVDEVLAVGDAAFQARCLGKMQDVAHNSGRTVLVVSHNLATIRQLCDSSIYLQGGQMKARLPAAEGVSRYLADEQTANTDFKTIKGEGIELIDILFCDVREQAPCATAIFGEDYELRLTLGNGLKGLRITPWIRIHDSSGILVSSICGPEEGRDFQPADVTTKFIVSLEKLSLMPGRYFVSVQIFSLATRANLDAPRAIHFDVSPANLGTATRAYRADHGLVRLCSSVRIEQIKGK